MRQRWKTGPSGRAGVLVMTHDNTHLIARFSSLDDATLGAAAPQMLDVLEMVFHTIPPGSPLHDRVRQAIRNATGALK